MDFLVDVRNGVPFRELAFVFAEHFIEHLPYWEAARFLRDVRAALAPSGILRLSTPNLDWVYLTQYHMPRDAATGLRDCFMLNASFRGWGHQFLYNQETLTALLHASGFAEVVLHRYGESTHDPLRAIERHPRSPDTEELPHVIIVEASGIGASDEPHLTLAATQFLEDLGSS